MMCAIETKLHTIIWEAQEGGVSEMSRKHTLELTMDLYLIGPWLV